MTSRVEFEELTYKNFLSTGDQAISIKLDAHFTTLVVGANGSGKSTMLDALSFVLFGKPHRKITKPQLLNSINQKACLVTITFRIGPVNYKIIRGIRPNIFEIWQDGLLLNQESHSRDYQKLLETNILKLNHKSFHQVVVLGSSNFVPFMQLIPYHRRLVIEDLLDIGVFTKMNTVLKERSARLKDSMRDTVHQIQLAAQKIQLQGRHIDSLAKVDRANAEQIEEEITTLQSEIAELQSKNAGMLHAYDDGYSIARRELETIQHTQARLHGYGLQIEAKIEQAEKDAAFYATATSCPTCKQDISDEHRAQCGHDCDTAISSLSVGHLKLLGELSSTRQKLEVANDSLGEITQLQSKVQANQTLIASHERRILDLNRQLNGTSSCASDTQKAKDSLTELREHKASLQELKGSQVDDRTYYELIGELLKDTGIKTKIIRQYLPVMNQLINKYLQILDFFVSFTLDENFDETMKSRHRDDFSYASFSEGEKARIDLALLFAWRQIARLKNSASTNLLILDETFDSSLDSEGVDNLMRIIQSFSADKSSIFVISHKPDILEGKFDRKLEFAKLKNFSSMSVSA